MMTKYELEYTLNTSPRILFNRLSTPGGLSEWFAEDVNLRKGKFTFLWEGTEQIAEVVSKKDNKFIRFKWEEDEVEEAYFEFKINKDELTGDLALIITDFAEEGEKEDAIDLWDSQISELKHLIGL
jgi:uncharacterized protein YndB with AHSA1/START domain